MSDLPGTHSGEQSGSTVERAVRCVGAYADEKMRSAAGAVRGVGGMAYLFADTLVWCFRGLFRPGVKLGRASIKEQMVRVGVDSIGIVMLVEFFIGAILAFQLAPVLASYGQVEQVAVPRTPRCCPALSQL